jgi:hypothetical protein
LLHWLGISENHLRVKLAIDTQEFVRLVTWVNEWNRYRPDASNVDDYFLKVVFTDNPALSCSPDAAMVLEVQGVSKAFYWEVDRGTSAEDQVAASKWRGYHELAVRSSHRERHFPYVTADDFSVIVVTTTRWRRDRLAKAFAKYDGAHRYLFCVQEELQPATFLHAPITINCQRVAAPLVNPLTAIDATIHTNSQQLFQLAATTSMT